MAKQLQQLPTTGTEVDGALARLRVPPHSLEAEQSVLGGLLIDNLAWDVVADLVNEDDFHRLEHRIIFGAIGRLVLAGRPADVVTTHAELIGLGKADEVGGLGYLNALAQAVPSATHSRRYAEIVRERAILRKLLATVDEIGMTVLNPQGRSAGQLLDEAEAKVLRIAGDGAGTQDFLTMQELVPQLIERVNELAEKGAQEVTGVATGFYDLDRKTSGLQPGDLIVLAARPSMGKTSLAVNMAEHVAIREGLPVLIFSMEMGASQLTLRMAGSQARIDQGLLRTGRLHDDDWGRLTEALERLGHAPIFIDQTPGLTAGELRARARRKARVCGPLGLIVVDYLQLMSGGNASSDENRATVLGEISRSLKSLAKELNCPVIALSQLNRAVESRNDKRPLMSDLRDSGAIEQDADVILFIYRDDYYNPETTSEPGVAEIILAKQRNGPVGTVKLGWMQHHTRFENLVSAQPL